MQDFPNLFDQGTHFSRNILWEYYFKEAALGNAVLNDFQDPFKLSQFLFFKIRNIEVLNT